MYHQINRRLSIPIAYSQMRLSIFPPGVRIHGINQLPLSPGNQLSFRSARVTIPFSSIFSSSRRINLQVDSPRILLNPAPGGGKGGTKLPFALNRVSISNGNLKYRQGKWTVQLLEMDLKSYKADNRLYYRLRSPHLKLIFPFSGEQVKIEGNVSATILQQGDRFVIQRLNWNTADFQATVNGRTLENGGFHMNVGFRGSVAHILEPLLNNISPAGLMYGNAIISGGKGGRVSIDSRFNFPEISINGEAFQSAAGTAVWNNRSERIRVGISMRDGPFQSVLSVTSRKSETNLRITNIPAERIMRIIEIQKDVPMNSRVISGDIQIKKRLFTGDLRLDRLDGNVPGFNVGGPIHFSYHSGRKEIHFHTPGLETEFGTMKLEGSNDGRARRLRIRVNAEVSDFSRVNKYTLWYTSIDLAPWKLRGGNGTFTLDLDKRYKELHFTSQLAIRGTSVNGVRIDSMNGTIHSEGSLIHGLFTFTDPEISGRAVLTSSKEYLDIQFPEVSGSMARIFQVIDLDPGVAGRGRGNATFHHDYAAPSPRIFGSFSSPNMDFNSFPFTGVSGKFETDTRTLKLKELGFNFLEGEGNARITINYPDRTYDLKGHCAGIRMDRVNGNIHGGADLDFSGRGTFNQDPIAVTFSSAAVHFFPGRSGILEGKAAIQTDFSDFHLEADTTIVTTNIHSPGHLTLDLKGGKISGDFKLEFNDLNLIIPWKNNRGRMALTGQVTNDATGGMDLKGIMRFSGEILSIPNFSHALKDFKGFIIFDNGQFTLNSFRATMGGGPVEGDGILTWADGGMKDFFLSLSGRNMTLYPIDRTSFVLNADLNLKNVGEKIRVQGNLNFDSGTWEREVDEGISFYTASQEDSSGSGLMEMLEFDLKLAGPGNIRMRNSFGDVTGSINLHLTGTPDFPRLTGSIESRTGDVYFSNHKFNLIKGRVTFNNRFVIDPIINIESETYIKSYRIRFNIKGISSRLRPEFQSSPPLAQQDILALLSLGELFKRPTSSEMSSQIGSTGLLTTPLTDEIQKRARKFGIDLVMKIDPVIAGTAREGTSRLTVGTSLSRNLVIVYSTNISSLRQEIYYLQYQLSPSISLIGMHNQDGNFSLDIRYRKRHY